MDGRTGQPKFQVNRFYSTDSNYETPGSATSDMLVWSGKSTHLDISIMPWLNNVTETTLIWLGKSQTFQINNPLDAASEGVKVYFTLNRYNLVSYRYYKKLDWLLGIIGGAMLLFYIILWVPCSYIARTAHEIDATHQLLLRSTNSSDEPATEADLIPATVSKWYWISNFITDKLFSEAKKAGKLVKAAE